MTFVFGKMKVGGFNLRKRTSLISEKGGGLKLLFIEYLLCAGFWDEFLYPYYLILFNILSFSLLAWNL